ncbi:endonuclease NucS [Candidatus Woesearchaeota archaeon]|nr:endonuclease NucS [Candidatus Woesearchaeota archaeon]
MKIDIASFNEALNNSKTVILACSCTVRYSGRAESFLDEGDRIIIAKSDGTLLVHQPTGSTPVNYMKNASHQLTLQDGKLTLSSRSLADKEYLDIAISKVHYYNFSELADSQSIQLVGSERDMSDMIYSNPSLIAPDFRPLSREEHTKYGFIDVFGYDKNNTLVIIECKRYVADLKAVDQLMRYIKKIKQLKGLKQVRGIIASPKISPNALQMLLDHKLEWKKVSPPKYMERYDNDQKKLGEY